VFKSFVVEAEEFLTDLHSGFVQFQVTAEAVQTSSDVAVPKCILNASTNAVGQRFSMSKVNSCVGIQMKM